MKKVLIGVTDCSKYAKYADWISADDRVEIVKISHSLNFDLVKKCDGVLLTGGEDVHPKFYNQPELLEYCYLDDVEEKRDDFELRVLDHTQRQRTPVLGICRGLQIANVFFGGTLIPDLPAFGKFNHSKFGEGNDRYHPVSIDPASQLSQITNNNIGSVNSAHHQATGKVGNGLVANCFSPDGVIEGLERIKPEGKPWLMLVQWHPERMLNQADPMTQKIKNQFIDSIFAK